MNETVIAKRALYYPYINAPDSPWFTRVLLYWDKVAAIIPLQFLHEPEKLEPQMQGYVKAGLIEPVVPGAFTWELPNFDGAFLRHLDFRASRDPRPREEWPRVHMEKLQELGGHLCERGLAKREGEWSPWFFVETQTAIEFMTYLAVVLGRMPTVDCAPITNEPVGFSTLIGKWPERLAPLRTEMLEEILPTPSASVRPEELAEFKMEHGKELASFRSEVEQRISEIAAITDDEWRQHRKATILAGMQEQRDALSEKIRKQKGWSAVSFGTLCAVAKAGIDLLTGGSLGPVKASLSVAPAVVDAFKGSSVTTSDGPMAYAALAHDRAAEWYRDERRD